MRPPARPGAGSIQGVTRYAQTNLQLFAQVRALDFCRRDRELLASHPVITIYGSP